MLSKEQEDMNLVQNILNGNHEAEEIFFKKYKKIIENYIKNNFPKINNDDFEDCVQEILIKIFYNLSKYNPEKSGVKTWVLIIAKHYLIDIWRNTMACNNVVLSASNCQIQTSCLNNSTSSVNSTHTATNNTDSLTAAPVSYSCTNSTLCNFENCNSISYISSQLSLSDFTLLDMKYIQGYNYKEIGNEFQLTSSTVSNKINYIKTKLKKSISDKDVLE